jgi:tetratricopeptide (TPR) repeat protein
MPAVSQPLASAFVAKNRLMYDRLVTFLDFAPERFTLGFVSVNFGRDQAALIEAVQVDPRNADLQIVELAFVDRELRYFKNALVERLATIKIEATKKLILIITGLEFAIGLLGEYPLVLQDLNYIRDAFVHTVPYPIVFVLPDGALTRLAKFAPDLWAWRKGVFTFESSELVIEAAYRETLDSDRFNGSLSKGERRERINLLERLLTDTSQESFGKQEIQLRTELGKHYRDLGSFDKAHRQLEQALELASASDNLILVKARVLQALSALCKIRGEIAQAIVYAEESANISNLFADHRTEAHALNVLADIQESQGEVDESFQLREKILQLCEQSSYLYGKAVTLHNMAKMIAQQGDMDRALNLWNQSLEIKEQIGDVKGKAATLTQIAGMIAQQGNMDRALSLWNQSLEIEEWIGDVQGKATTLFIMADTLATRGDFDTAIAYLKESLALLQQMRDAKAPAVQQTLEQVRQLKAAA